MDWLRYPQENGDLSLRDAIIELEETAWPAEAAEKDFPAAPDSYVTSFVLMDRGRAVCHAGIRKAVFQHKGLEYLAYGLSEVVTAPAYRRQGFGSAAVGKAADFILSAQPDISIFTCEPKRVGFYTAGGWQAVPACLVGGTEQAPFRSDSLGLVTMIRFISEKGKDHKGDFEHTDIFLALGKNQLW